MSFVHACTKAGAKVAIFREIAKFSFNYLDIKSDVGSVVEGIVSRAKGLRRLESAYVERVMGLLL